MDMELCGKGYAGIINVPLLLRAGAESTRRPTCVQAPVFQQARH